MRPTSSSSQLELQFVNFCLKADGDKIRFREIEAGTIELAFAAADRPAAHEFIGKSVILMNLEKAHLFDPISTNRSAPRLSSQPHRRRHRRR